MKNIVFVSLLILAFIVGCKKKEDAPAEDSTVSTTTTGSNPATISITSTPQVQFDLDGTSKSYVESYTSPMVTNGQSNSGAITSPTSTMTVGTGFSNSTGAVIRIHKGLFSVPSGINGDAAFTAFFPKTSQVYSANASNGIKIEWFDSTGALWSTDQGIANQTGSVLTIVDNAQDYVRDGSGYLMMKVYATFNCKLYNTSGSVKTITNGKFVGYYSYH